MNRLALSAIRQLLHLGEASAGDLAGFERLRELGVVRLSADGSRVVAAPRKVRLLRRLGAKEAEAGVFALHSEFYTAWLRIVCARLEEKGIQRDAEALFDAIGLLGAASGAAVEAWNDRGLGATTLTALEREILGSPAHEAVAAPRLLRAVAAAGAILADPVAKELSPLADIHDLDPSKNWVAGRILLPPDAEPIDGASAVLSGSLSPLKANGVQDSMKWALARPWAFLLGQIVFTQEAWRAERISGQLELELDRDQVETFHQPAQVRVVITMPDGAEVQCGTVGELVRRVLDDLGVALLTADVSTEALDAMLAPVIGTLLKSEVWAFESGRTGQEPGYRIHPTFSDQCYRTLGSQFFYRKGAHITMAIRRTCEQWVKERLTRAGAVTTEEGTAA